MRLTCPNCDAQYEVDEAVIPDSGRDVQCSSCGHTWFQPSALMLREAEADHWEDEATESADLPATPMAVESAPPVADAAPEPTAQPAPSTVPDAPTGLQRRTLDDAVLNVLREEADRETQARKAEGSALETQGDLGLAPPPHTPPIAPAPAPAEPEADTTVIGADTEMLVSRAARRELLPDIEEINSTLRATSERGNEAAAMDAPESLRQRRYGFRRGFVSALSVMVLLLLPYILAENLSVRFPSMAPAIAGYAHRIDAVRLWMDRTMKSSTQSMQDSNGQSTAP